MDKNEEIVSSDEPVRRTRSGRTVRPPAIPSNVVLKTPARKKKKVMVEVEVSDEDEPQEEANASHNEEHKETDQQTEVPTMELENSDNAVEASEQFIQNDRSDFDNCSNTAQFPEDSNNVTDNEINSFRGAINTCESNEITDAEDLQNFKPINSDSKSSLPDEGLADEFMIGADSLAGEILEADSLAEPLRDGFLSGGESLHGPDISAGDSLPNLDVKMDTEDVIQNTNIEHMDTTNEEDSSKKDIQETQFGKTESKGATQHPDDDKFENETDDKIKELEETSSNVPIKTMENGDPDTEVISEDELPGVQVAKVPETEEVSDDELPGPKRAELPADTEVVSEDELPTVKKEAGTKRKLTESDYDPGSPTSENENPSKKATLEVETEKEKEEKSKPKKLPELDKYWKAVNDDPTDFTGWTYLLQYVDQENDMEAAREAYDAFLSHYPYCYGYWRKYADYEKRKGNKKRCEEVFERGLKAIPLSVDLWIHYLTYVRTSRPDEEDYIRSQFERALTSCGLEFRSDRLWDSFIKWETDAKRLVHVTAIYDRLLAVPTQGYTTHFDNFQEHVASHTPNKILDVDEFLALRKEVKHLLKHDAAKAEDAESENSDVPPGEDDNMETASSDEEVKGIRERIVSIRRKVHKNTVNSVTIRWNYEEGIKRPYFHVKPLERCQLKNWQDYLDFEIEKGDQPRIIVLFERCLIACALYDEFWVRYVLYLEALKDPEMLQKIKDTYERACTIHHLKKPNLHTQWAMFEESIENYDRAAEILINLEKSVPNLLQVAYRRINLERRRGEYDKCCQLYEHYISNVKNKVVASNISIKYARFCHRIMKNLDKAIELLNTAITKDPNNARLYLQLIDFNLQKGDITEIEVLSCIDMFLKKEGVENEQKLLFAQRKFEYLEDFGTTTQGLYKAQEEYQKYLKLVKESVPKKKEVAKTDSVPSSKKEKNPPLPSSQSNSYGNYGNYSNSPNSSNYSQYPASQQGQYNYSQYGQGDQYNYQNWQYPQGGYGGYNQWSGYGGGYSY